MRDFVKAYLPEKGEKMLKQLGNRLKEFGETPLLLWMLCSVFENNKSQIPANLGLVFQSFTEEFDIRKREREGVKISDRLRRWQKRLLKNLAWVMTTGETPTEIKLSISRSQAEKILIEFLQGKVPYPDDTALEWLEDLLKYYLIQVTPDKQNIEFCHQLIQEYYTAEELLEKLPHLRDDELKWDYLNYTKWTETIALMLGLLDSEIQARRVVKLGLEIDLKLGARLAGEVKVKFQKETVGLVLCLDVPKYFKVELLGLTKSDEVVNELNQALEDSDKDVRRNAAKALGNIGSEAAIPGLVKALKHSNEYVRRNAAYALGNIGSEAAIPELVKALEHSDWGVRRKAAEALGNIGSEAAIPLLLQALKHSDWDVRRNAAEALGNIGSEAAIPWLIKALEDSDMYVRGNAAEALGKIGSEAAIPGLVQALEHSHGDVRRYAAYALGNIGSEAAIPGLVRA
jgi:predicted NACHT family NTPase